MELTIRDQWAMADEMSRHETQVSEAVASFVKDEIKPLTRR